MGNKERRWEEKKGIDKDLKGKAGQSLGSDLRKKKKKAGKMNTAAQNNLRVE